jgi:hypothetical protein
MINLLISLVRDLSQRLHLTVELGKLLATFPDLQLPREENIQDFSKADAFTKEFTRVQSVWLIVQSIA